MTDVEEERTPDISAAVIGIGNSDPASSEEQEYFATEEIVVPVDNSVHQDELLNGAKATPSNVKCGKCSKRMAREGCTQLACLQCCDDFNGCESHRKPRAHALWKEQVLAGTTDVQSLAAAKRKMRIPAGRVFREPGFVYQGDTVVIWDLRAFARNPKWREEAIRKSIRRSKVTPRHIPRLRNSRKRFRRLMTELYLARQQEAKA